MVVAVRYAGSTVTVVGWWMQVLVVVAPGNGGWGVMGNGYRAGKGPVASVRTPKGVLVAVILSLPANVHNGHNGQNC